ncbi:hypothetical protein B0J13DRAFT_2712 [Dactylonectria estremocensis]|uniref:F-box domain-containing protein n=1 Tax=Dactylonectria estremocensis TaxID=1079267 RepID=A0A9P9FHE0_9HYPO|nr:hypothetical protein B0J13DRAFT_2712 [Dactylonectria estremocensis]
MDATQSVSPAISKPNRLDEPASFELLAPEILLQIVTNLPGLDTLWNLLCASPHVWRLFSSHALAITEGIISGPNSILPLRVQEIVRAVILTRSKALPFQNLEEFQVRFMRSMMPHGAPKGAVLKVIGPKALSASTVSVPVLRSVVVTAYQASALSQACLASCLARIRDPSFKPLHADPSPQYGGDYGDDPEVWVPAWDREFIGKPVQVVDAGQPSWVEEMRALRAVWLIQLMGEVQCLVADEAETVGWPDEDIHRLSKMDTVDVVTELPETLLSREEEVKSMVQYIATRGDATKETFYRLPRAPSASASPRWITASPKRTHPPRIVRGFCRNGKFHPLPKGSAIPEDGTPPFKWPDITDSSKWGQTESFLASTSQGIFTFRCLTAGDHLYSPTPIPGVKFESFRPLGFAFWDRRRMHLLGLSNGISYKGSHPDVYLFAFESILPPGEVASLKAELRRSRAQQLSTSITRQFPSP